ncbi:Alpha/Beta hydrolase protein [Plectosphaerella plurivora]|uniref:Carboxylic ester hydrolase n=1 Tax=Plectosphaerella plurivora TaxID=936078 RepID=A0A9P8V8L9_9PEZI|nr:Alpha/Beta hydrolase protein [Plectosphaerella plurivora]
MKSSTITTLYAVLVSLVRASPLGAVGLSEGTTAVTQPAVTFIGSLVNDVEYYRGIPYAQPPTGNLRLRPPKPVENVGIIDATGIGPACPQFTTAGSSPVLNRVVGVPGVAEGLFFASAQGNETEDCLTLSVMRPGNTQPDEKLPVLFWIHGGAFQTGSAQPFNASVLVPRGVSQDKPFILVATNYRLGGFGFLGGKEILEDGAANLGLLDQRMALEWVADNIASFGGDPNAVTIWGESAGARSVFDQLALYDGDNTHKGRPLFRAAIMNSGSLAPAEPVDGPRAQNIFDTVVDAAGCGAVPSSEKLDCLRGLDVETFANATTQVPSYLSYNNLALSYAPRPDGRTLTASPETLAQEKKFAAVPMIIGTQENEGTVFGVWPYNVTTRAEAISYLSDVYFPDASLEQISHLVDLYTPCTVESTVTTSVNETYPEFKRLSAIFGDYEFTLIGRVLLDLTNENELSWSYLATYGRDTPIVGTYHTEDLPRMFAKTDDSSRAIQDRFISFLYHLDPNGALADRTSPRWPSWQESRELFEFGASSVGVLDGDFRDNIFQYIRDNLNEFRH